MNKQINFYEDLILWIGFFALFILLMTCAYFFEKEMDKKGETFICNDVKTFYKDNLLFDKYYISCENGRTLEIKDANTFVKFKDGENYEIELTKGNLIHKVTLLKEN